MGARVIFLLTVLLGFSLVHKAEQSSRFGTKTAYHFNASAASSLKIPANCHPVHLNMIVRHGSRYPSDGDREDIDEFLGKLNKIYNESAPFRYQNLTIPWSKPTEWNNAMPSELSAAGENEQYNIATRYRSRFPQVFDKEYWNKYYTFVTSDKLRNAQSAMAFAFGLFEGRGPVASSNFQPVAITFSGRENDDKLLNSYNSCPRYEIDVKEHGVEEVEKFMAGPEVKDTVRRLEQRLKLNGKLSLTFDYVEKIFRLCSFGIMNRGDNTWCPLLQDEDMKILEYQGDLEAYYEHSYGNKLSYKVVCPLLSEMTTNLQKFSEGKIEARGVFRFASSGSLTSLLTILGLYNDSVPLKADNYLEQSHRLFRLSNAVTMSANIALVLLACNSTEMAGKQHYKVQVLVNEAPVGLPCCHGNMTCGLDRFLACYEDTVKGCDFDAMCNVPPTGGIATASAAIFYPHPDMLALAVVLLIFKNI